MITFNMEKLKNRYLHYRLGSILFSRSFDFYSESSIPHIFFMPLSQNTMSIERNATTTCTMYIHSLVTEKIYQNFNVRHLYIRWVKSLFSTTYIYRTTVEKIYIIKHSIEFNGTIEADLNLNLFIGYASIPIFVVYSFKYYIGVPLQC